MIDEATRTVKQNHLHILRAWKGVGVGRKWQEEEANPLKLWREPLQSGLDFAHEVQRARHADHVRGLYLTACLRQGHHRIRLNLDRDAMLADNLCESVRITRARIVEVGYNDLMRYGCQGGNNVSDS